MMNEKERRETKPKRQRVIPAPLRPRILLLKRGKVGHPLDISFGNGVADLASRRVALKDDDAAVGLQRRSNAGAVAVEGEVARVDAARRGRLHVGEGARLLVDGEGDERVRGHLGAVGNRVLERALKARREGKEVAPGL